MPTPNAMGAQLPADAPIAQDAQSLSLYPVALDLLAVGVAPSRARCMKGISCRSSASSMVKGVAGHFVDTVIGDIADHHAALWRPASPRCQYPCRSG